MQNIKLPRGVWLYDPGHLLGRKGGFGAVYAGSADGHGELAIKRLHLQAAGAAHREMRIANELVGRQLNHVVNVLDAGEDSGSYFVVMPRAVKSLQQDIDAGKMFGEQETAGVLLAIATGLREVPEIVHRDLKPDNVLFHDGRWKVADFGIARFVEDSTSLQTLRECLTPTYAAPEQWLQQRATQATDIYALGCIGYALITGYPPFMEVGERSLRDQHLYSEPPTLGCSPRLASFLGLMLQKLADARPSLGRVLSWFGDLARNPPAQAAPGFNALAEAAVQVARSDAAEECQRREKESELARREQLAASARSLLYHIFRRLQERVSREAPNAMCLPSSINLGQAVLEISLQLDRAYRMKYSLPTGAFPQSNWNVVAAEEIVVHQGRPGYSWSASLWYACLPGSADYRWYEASYFIIVPSNRPMPFSLMKSIGDADLAASPVAHVYQIAFGPAPVEAEFAERWAMILALAAQGRLRQPGQLPLEPEFWRHFMV